MQLALLDRIHEAQLALHRVVRLGVALENDHLAARPELPRQRVAGQLRPGPVVGAEEGEIDSGRLFGVLVEFDVDVDHLDAVLHRLGDRRDHRLRVGRRDDDDVVFLRDEILDRVDLRGEVTFVLHADRLEIELVAVLGGVGLSARLHLLEELVGKRLHHQADLRLVGRERRLQASGQNRGRADGAGHDETAAREAAERAEIFRSFRHLAFLPWGSSGRLERQPPQVGRSPNHELVSRRSNLVPFLQT